ncbi:hypothetical protein [Altericista sp. CCNU0014]|uniref:hypothetical protein n=1 Tax=Altericista sp. CCNU0014 TaxID=3082949 RepID=UPI0038504744
MLQTLWAEVKQGKIELLELADLPEGTKVLVTLLPASEADRWVQKTTTVTDSIWDDIEDRIQIPTRSE